MNTSRRHIKKQEADKEKTSSLEYCDRNEYPIHVISSMLLVQSNVDSISTKYDIKNLELESEAEDVKVVTLVKENKAYAGDNDDDELIKLEKMKNVHVYDLRWEHAVDFPSIASDFVAIHGMSQFCYMNPEIQPHAPEVPEQMDFFLKLKADTINLVYGRSSPG
ncbi:hypothetical protein CPB84DRAFT_1823119 [Gymnopilus junonius]|uniref:Uncharacterized protein n=1 Tax=Gymnopilus junonius TaxID=109634 RepID=A0A9P5TPN8_GYMJU|nr:hypothetical protein CPB84DRAFT_1823119 [Gymnopilus junonius]